MLSSAATKREAKSYLSRFSLPKPVGQPQVKPVLKYEKLGVNLGNLYLPLRAIDESPVFIQTQSKLRFADQTSEPLHVAIVKIRAPQSIDDKTLEGVGHTLSQLTRLGLSCVVIVDYGNEPNKGLLKDSHLIVEQADRVVSFIDRYEGQGARRIDGIIEVSPIEEYPTPALKVRGEVRITHRNLLLAPIRRGIIPVVLPVGFTSNTQTLVNVLADEVLLALTRVFAGVQVPSFSDDEDPREVSENVRTLQKQFSLDRIILLDPLGGIPSLDGVHGSHVFINMEQEYSKIKEELLNSMHDIGKQELAKIPDRAPRTFASGNSSLDSSKRGCTVTYSKNRSDKKISNMSIDFTSTEYHIKNLELLKNALAILPPSSSALLTTPQAAANSGQTPQQSSPQILGVGTRRKRNPLIHNLLTDKPVFSSSLPPTRTQNPKIHPHETFHPVSTPSPATFIKRGMPISIIPDPLTHPWTPPTPNSPATLQLSDPCIDLPRLVHLIEDSFGRKLNVPHYLSRLTNRLAGIIIAGEYEGGALLTWETPPLPPTSSHHQQHRPPVPYLDKFAVLKRSQGAGGVADIVFKAMVRDCLPDGVCWRSRQDNPVNRWYFERALGSWKMPGTQWTMFWTTERVERERGNTLFGDYERVCKGVEPSWVDCTGAVD